MSWMILLHMIQPLPVLFVFFHYQVPPIRGQSLSNVELERFDEVTSSSSGNDRIAPRCCFTLMHRRFGNVEKRVIVVLPAKVRKHAANAYVTLIHFVVFLKKCRPPYFSRATVGKRGNDVAVIFRRMMTKHDLEVIGELWVLVWDAQERVQKRCDGAR